jgi:hypothetical protein
MIGLIIGLEEVLIWIFTNTILIIYQIILLKLIYKAPNCALLIFIILGLFVVFYGIFPGKILNFIRRIKNDPPLRMERSNATLVICVIIGLLTIATSGTIWMDPAILESLLGPSNYLTGLNPDTPSPLPHDSSIIWTAIPHDKDKGDIQYRFWHKRPKIDDEWHDETGWINRQSWTWNTSEFDLGDNQVKVQIKMKSSDKDYDDEMIANYIIVDIPPTISDLICDTQYTKTAGCSIIWMAEAKDPEGDHLQYRFLLKGPGTDKAWHDETGWIDESSWTWSTSKSDIGDNEIKVQVKDNIGNEEYDAEKTEKFLISKPSPIIDKLNYELSSPQDYGCNIDWIAEANDPDGCQLHYRFLLKGPGTDKAWHDETGWIDESSWTWSTSKSDIGDNEIKVQVKDNIGNEEYDAEKTEKFLISKPPPTIQKLKPDTPQGVPHGSIVTWEAEANDPSGDHLQYRFLLKGPGTDKAWHDETGWMDENSWTWRTSVADVGKNEIMVEVRDTSRAETTETETYIISYCIGGSCP